MDYAKKSLGLLSPRSLSKCVSASASVTQQLLAGPAPRPRPYRVNNCERTLRKGIVAETLNDLLEKVRTALDLVGSLSLVLDEDGTSIDSEEFFQTLEEGTVLLALTEEQVWRPAKKAGYQLSLSHKPRRHIDVARITFDLYKTNPQDFLGSLNIKATLYGTYSMSYDMQCYGAKRMVKEALRWTLFTMQATGHILLGTSCYMQHLLDAPEEQKESTLTSSFPPSLALPSSLTRRMLQ
ncbi:cell death activator CIDE-3 [Notechis scutatus]|uniref:Cell death activator CIDE-3 n=1 Tax=Notechis scutatus TaxID=8663 RepID=A0A6J1VZP2_9SAUR|nr:cell death activator CIDE-3 [Notechis scutatus]XP_026545493.1 cell death activator CIDE-3 [Notechis scutatus]XP_026545494.1 cell death activator CIDE-3 [Notechis scutatus]XP_026545495.1 cell death activator CIDE-3 [Notechis scutatus]